MSHRHYKASDPEFYITDTDWQTMTPTERGCFHSLLMYISIACDKKREMENDRLLLSKLCNTDEETFMAFWGKYSEKLPNIDMIPF